MPNVSFVFLPTVVRFFSIFRGTFLLVETRNIERTIQKNYPLPIKNLLLFTFTYIIGKLHIVLIKDTFNKVTASMFLAFKFRSRTNRPASIFGVFTFIRSLSRRHHKYTFHHFSFL